MARSFNGSSDYISADAAHIAGHTNSWTMCCWISAAPQPGERFMFVEGSSTNQNPIAGLAAQTGSTKVEWYYRSDAGPTATTFGVITALDGKPHHLALVCDVVANLLYGYVDGALDLTKDISNLGSLTTNLCTVGALNRAIHGNFFVGAIAHAANWGAALAAAEVVQLAAGISPLDVRPDALNLYLPLLGDPIEPDLRALTAVTMNGTKPVAELVSVRQPRSLARAYAHHPKPVLLGARL